MIVKLKIKEAREKVTEIILLVQNLSKILEKSSIL